MRKFFLSILVASAATVAQAADLKIAVVDPMTALGESEQVKRQVAALEKELAGDKAQLTRIENDLKTCQQRRMTEMQTMSESVRAKFQVDCENKQREGQILMQAFQRTVNERQQKIFQEMGPRLRTAMEKVVKEGGYDLVLQREATIHFKPELDITAKVTAAVNAAK